MSALLLDTNALIWFTTERWMSWVRLPEDLLKRAKRKAAVQGRTLTSLIEDGLRRVIAENEADAKRKRVLPRVSTATGGPAGD